MAKLPAVSGAEAQRAFERAGYQFDHQTGSHMILRQVNPPHRTISVPKHREMASGTLRGLIRDAGFSVDEFVELLKGPRRR